jgi:hypothetical protein
VHEADRIEGFMMRHLSAAMFLIFACCFSPSCGIRVLVHDEQAAATSATKFADVAFVRSDYAGAHALLSSQMQQSPSTDKLAAEVTKMQPQVRPSEVAATEFEPLPA